MYLIPSLRQHTGTSRVSLGMSFKTQWRIQRDGLVGYTPPKLVRLYQL